MSVRTRCLAAWTAITSPYPPYVNISQAEDGRVAITVRSVPGVSAERPDGTTFPVPGDCAIATMSADEFAKLMTEVERSIRT